MFTTVSVQLSPTTLLRLVEWQRREGGTHDLSETLNAALDFWLDAKTALPPGADPSQLRGYQWRRQSLKPRQPQRAAAKPILNPAGISRSGANSATAWKT